MSASSWTFDAQVWEWDGQGAWHFVTLPFEVADEVADRVDSPGRSLTRGFGSVRVHVTIGSSTWSTSLFPDNKRKSYLLPLKKPVRVKEGAHAGTTATITITLADVEDS